jgi:drug/metabolite transporter (DMT)-like permease
MPRDAAGTPPAPAGGAIQAYLLLVFTMVCWGGNAVAGRLAVGQASPMVITCLRWGIVAACLGAVTSRQLVQARAELRRDWRRIVLMAICGYSIFNALFYVAAYHTTAVNISILQGAVPIFVVLGALVLHRTQVGALQVLGIALTLLGVAVVATHGHVATLAAFHFNLGDGLMLVACFLYAGYTLALRHRPKIPSFVFFAAMSIIAFLTSLPLLAFEVLTDTAQWPTPNGWAIIGFIVVFPSFAAQLAFMRGVQLIGPSRAGLFANLVPLFGAVMAVVILDEPFAPFHLVALILVLAGIVTAEAARKSSRPYAAKPDAAVSEASLE